MFRDNTTFVVGAGASVEFGLPVGTQLAQRIKKSSLLHIDNYRERPRYGDEFFMDTIKRIWPTSDERKPVLDALDAIHQGIHTAVSIDAFIHRNHNDKYIPQLGKMLIALEILKAEQQSSMHEDNIDALHHVDGINPDLSWIGQFVRILFDGVTDPRKVGNGVRIICFNYDRCIEYYLRQAIIAAFRIPVKEAQDIVAAMDIIHPYGWLGELPLNRRGFGDGKVAFGASGENIKLDEIAENIRTYTEQFEDADIIGRIHNAISDCNVLVFLGFGFNNQNLDLLRVKYLQDMAPRNVYATGFNISKEVDDTMKRRIRHLYSKDEAGWKIEDWNARIRVGYSLTCVQLFETHNMNLSKFTQSQIRCYDGVPRLERVSSNGAYAADDG